MKKRFILAFYLMDCPFYQTKRDLTALRDSTDLLPTEEIFKAYDYRSEAINSG
jgi:hypothetical protein